MVKSVFVFSMLACAAAAEAGMNVGDPAPTFSLQSLNGQTTFDLASFRGQKAVFLNIFNTWCGPCVRETPDLVKAYPHYKEKVEFVSVCTPWRGDSAEKVKRFVDRFSVPWTMTFDASGEVTKIYEVEGVPTNVVIGQDGRILFYLAGALSEEAVKKVLDAAAEGKSPEMPGGTMALPKRPRAKPMPAPSPLKDGDPWIGVSFEEKKALIAKAMAGAQVVITEVVKGGPAEQAGLAAGDLVISVDGQTVAKVQEVINIVRAHKPGDVLKVEVKSQMGAGESRIVAVTVGRYASKNAP